MYAYTYKNTEFIIPVIITVIANDYDESRKRLHEMNIHCGEWKLQRWYSIEQGRTI